MAARKTVIEETTSRRQISTPAFASALIFAVVVVLVGAFLIGRSDNGQINVAATIQNSNQAAMNGEGGQPTGANAVPEAFRDKPNGGLVASENQEQVPPPQPQTETGTTSGTSTDSVASSTPETQDGTQAAQTENTSETPVDTTQNAGQ